MNKLDLVLILSDRMSHLRAENVRKSVNEILDLMTRTLKDRRRIEIRNFGSFRVREHVPAYVRNPRDGTRLYKENRISIHFKPGKEMREKVNDM